MGKQQVNSIQGSKWNKTGGNFVTSVLSSVCWPIVNSVMQSRFGCLYWGCLHGSSSVCWWRIVICAFPFCNAKNAWWSKSFCPGSQHCFSTDEDPSKSKSKCIFVKGKKLNASKPAPLMLGDHTLQFFSEADHLGNIHSEIGDFELDASNKWARFIHSAVEVRERFKWAAPQEIIWATKLYSSSFYWSEL